MTAKTELQTLTEECDCSKAFLERQPLHRGTYEVLGQCVNCKTKFRLLVPRGHGAPRVAAQRAWLCPDCQCHTVVGK